MRRILPLAMALILSACATTPDAPRWSAKNSAAKKSAASGAQKMTMMARYEAIRLMEVLRKSTELNSAIRAVVRQAISTMAR